MRKVFFYVQSMHWDNVYSCYYATCLFGSESYEDCEKFCLNYSGTEETIYIQKAFKQRATSIDANMKHHLAVLIKKYVESEITNLKEENERLNEEVKFFPSLKEQRNLHEQVTKLKKSREVLRQALEHTWPGSTYAIDVNAFNRRAINLDDEIMGGGE